jgi:DNA-binding SARP family transcriptional activator
MVTRLSIRLFGPLQVTLDGETAGFESDKVRALLAYLAVESESPHRREKLAGLLWPDWPEGSARNNLRHTLAVLRKTIGDREASPPFLHVTRQTVQFNVASDAWVDVAAFGTLLQSSEPSGQPSLERWEEAARLYQGDFLEGFSLADSAAFEEWVLQTREQYRRQAMETLQRVAEGYGERGEQERALEYAWRQTELDPWREEAHRQVMRLLAQSGRRSEALAQYRTCCRLLAEELGVEPSRETTRLYEQIRDGALAASAPLARAPHLVAEPPPFLEGEEPVEVERPVFVARERELAQLQEHLDLTLADRGRVVFVTGEVGSGKTALVEEFSRRAQEACADLIVASGSCNAYTGIGDPYLPFREILALLTGDVEARWAAGAMTREHARRLWDTLPLTVQALVEAGPDLIDTFVPRVALLEHALTGESGMANWLTRLNELVERKPTSPGMPSPQQSDLFEQYTRVLQALAQQGALLLVLDDLQWADLGSISLLFHLGRHLAGSRILVVGTYRPEQVAIGRDGERHPLESVVNEFQRDFGEMTVKLGRAESRAFVEALLDSEPNRLGGAFGEMLYRQTHGHPLFTIELLRGMQERGDLVQDPYGRWIEGPALDWETLPARVEAVIAERIGRLAQPLRAALRVASVEGEVFTAEVVARVQGADEREVVRRLSGDLDRRHRLVGAQAIERLGSRRLSRYRFRHSLFQRYLYDSLDRVERAYLHEDVGTVLEGLYGDQVSGIGPRAATGELAVQLARHFEEAGITDKAIHYLHQAGERAVQLSAYQEAIAHLTRGLALLMTLPDSGDAAHRLERDEQELDLQLTLGMAWVGGKGYGPEVERIYSRARELCQQMGKTSGLCRAVGELSIVHYVEAEYQTARELAEEALSLAQQVEDPLLVVLGTWHLGFMLFALGEYATALAHLEQVIAFYDPQKHHRSLVALRGSDPGPSAMAYAACCLWCLGYPDQAARRSQEALALARELDHPFSLIDALSFGGCLFNTMRRDVQALNDCARETKRWASEKVPGWLGQSTRSQGEALAMMGDLEEGIAQMQAGLTFRQSEECYRSGCFCSLAEAQARAGRPEEGLATLAEALALVEEIDERYYEAELYRMKGELLLLQGEEAEAEASLQHAESSFQHAIKVARHQQARSWELRATTSLCRLWHRQGRVSEARRMLSEVYDWFTEGFDTPDLLEARALLEELS